MALERKVVEHVAKLARLELSEQELKTFSQQLDAILKYVDQLKKLDVAHVHPLSHASDIHSVFREDVPRPSLPKEDVLRNAPERSGDFFSVPKIIER